MSNKKKKYALWKYHNSKEGYERWEYICEVPLSNPVKSIVGLFKVRFPNQIGQPTVKSFDAKIQINNVWFQRMYVAFNNGNELVLAERIIE